MIGGRKRSLRAYETEMMMGVPQGAVSVRMHFLRLSWMAVFASVRSMGKERQDAKDRKRQRGWQGNPAG